MNLVSIIVPIYNTEKFLHKCLDSIITQTYTNWEAILIDDGSPDDCGKICEEYAQKDCRFKVFHQKNGGVSVARQTGLNNSIGDYIIHCDPDDWVEPTMLEEMLECAIKNNADMVICDFISHFNDNTRYESQEIGNDVSAAKIQRMILEGELHGSCWNKLIKKECIKGIGFYPSNILYCEDLLFNIRVLNHNVKAVHLAHAYYHYNLTNESSICNSPSKKAILSRCIVVSEIEKIIEEKEYKNLYLMKRDILESLFKIKCFKEFKETYTEIHKDIVCNRKKYTFFTPFGYFFAKALEGNPQTYFFLYKCNLATIKLIQKLRGKTV